MFSLHLDGKEIWLHSDFSDQCNITCYFHNIVAKYSPPCRKQPVSVHILSLLTYTHKQTACVYVHIHVHVHHVGPFKTAECSDWQIPGGGGGGGGGFRVV